jgi:hypothetical protein
VRFPRVEEGGILAMLSTLCAAGMVLRTLPNPHLVVVLLPGLVECLPHLPPQQEPLRRLLGVQRGLVPGEGQTTIMIMVMMMLMMRILMWRMLMMRKVKEWCRFWW